MIYETDPPWKMPDDEELPHNHHVCLRVDFDHMPNGWCREYIGDLTEYYEWVKFQGIEKMEHNIMRTGHEDANKSVNVLVMFTFSTLSDAVAFKLMWK